VIDLWTTAVTVNALMEIRDILERRALQLCEKRFSVARKLKTLEEVSPVDLGARHDQRLHRQLLEVVRKTRSAEKSAKYSFVFHGPPGSSKTLLANALAQEMWQPRPALDHEILLIRITPADFTQQGGDRLDAEARFIFKLLSHTRRVTILFDEIDDLLRERLTPGEATFFKLVVPAMLNRLQDLRDVAEQQEICFILSTNFIDRIDPALIRRGRMDRAIPVPYPDAFSRYAIFEKEGVPPPDFDIVESTEGLPYVVVKRIAEERTPLPFTQEEKANDVQQHYDDPLRWRRSTPLLNEWLRCIAARRSDQNANRTRIAKLKKYVPAPSKQFIEGAKSDFNDLCDQEGRFATGTLDKLRKP
jgi:hypothetical protein